MRAWKSEDGVCEAGRCDMNWHHQTLRAVGGRTRRVVRASDGSVTGAYAESGWIQLSAGVDLVSCK